MKKLRLYFKIIYSFIISWNGSKNSKFLNLEATIKYSIENKKSIIRMGDGEFNILDKRDVHYQKYCKELKIELENIIDDYIKDYKNTNYLLCMPGDYLKIKSYNLLQKKDYFLSWSLARLIFKKNYDLDISYGDAFLFAKGNEKEYKKLWINLGVEKIIFVHNNVEYAKKFESIYGIKTEAIKVPAEDAYFFIKDILHKILELNGNEPSSLILISAGPAAKVLVYMLSKLDILAIDTGHCWDNPLNKINKWEKR